MHLVVVQETQLLPACLHRPMVSFLTVDKGESVEVVGCEEGTAIGKNLGAAGCKQCEPATAVIDPQLHAARPFARIE